MSNIIEFTNHTIENIGYYVYCLIDPRDNNIFYIGKGCRNRIFAHELEIAEKAKNKKIDEIKLSGLDVQKYIIRHGLNEDEAFHVEATLIDLLSSPIWTKASLLNIVAGHHNFDNGMKSVNEIEAFYCVDEIRKSDIKHNCLIVNINKTYQKQKDVYEATRSSWLLNKNKIADIDLVISEYNGIFRAVYRPEHWLTEIDEKGRERWLFEGKDVSGDYPEYVNKKNSFKKKGMANPICYIFQ